MKWKPRAAALLLALIVALGNPTALAADTSKPIEDGTTTPASQETDQTAGKDGTTTAAPQETDQTTGSLDTTGKTKVDVAFAKTSTDYTGKPIPLDEYKAELTTAIENAHNPDWKYNILNSAKETVTTFTDAGTYTITATYTDDTHYGQATQTFTVNRASLSIDTATVAEKTYDGTKNAEVTAVTFTGWKGDEAASLKKGTDYDVTAAAFQSANVGDNQNVEITVELKNTDLVKNYKLSSNTKTVTGSIKKAAATDIMIADIPTQSYAGGAEVKPKISVVGTVNESTKTLASTDYTVTYSNNTAVGEAAVTIEPATGGNYTFSKASATFTINDDNYIVTGKKVTKSYDGKQLSAPTGTAKFNGLAVAGTWSWVTDTTTMIDVGTYTATVLFTPSSTNKNGLWAKESTVTVTITKAATTGKPSYTPITQSGRTLASAELSEGTLSPAGGELIWIDVNGNKLPGSTTVRADTAYTWKYTPDSNHTTVTGTLTPYSSDSSVSTGSSTNSTTDSSKSSPTTTNESSSATKTTTTTNTDTATGVKTETTTQTTTANDGTVTKDVVETSTTSRGTTVSTKTTISRNGNTSTTVTANVSEADVTNAGGGVITLPTCVTATKANSFQTAPTVTITVPAKAGSVKVEIPVSNVTAGTVAMKVKTDGSTEPVKWSAVTDDGLALNVSGTVTVQVVDNSTTFQDARNHWASSAIAFVSSRELFQGTSETTFSPEGEMTRAMLMTVLARLDGVDTSTGANWYTAGMNWAKKHSVSDGTDPESSITREQLATMLYRYAGEPVVTSTVRGFSDADKVSSWAVNAMSWAVSKGLIQGVGSNKLDPAGPATRAQVAAMLMRYVGTRLK